MWIDFGVTNARQYVKTVEQLKVGGIYEGWRLPTLEETMTMFANLAHVEGEQADIEYAETGTSGRFEAQDANTIGSDDSIWDSVFDVESRAIALLH